MSEDTIDDVEKDPGEDEPGTEIELAGPQTRTLSRLQLPPGSFAELAEQAERISKSGVVPQDYRGKPNDIIAAGLMGAEQGWPLMVSLRSIYVVHGKPGFSAEAMGAKIRAAGHSLSFKFNDDETKCTVWGKRGDNGDQGDASFSIDDAVRAGLVGRDRDGNLTKVGNKDVWVKYPRSLLYARALTQLARWLFQDVLLAMNFTPEELGDESWIPVPMEAVEVIVDQAEQGGSVFDTVVELYDLLYDDDQGTVDDWLGRITDGDGVAVYPDGFGSVTADEPEQFLDRLHRVLMKAHATANERDLAGDDDEVIDAEIVPEPEPAPDAEASPIEEHLAGADDEILAACLTLPEMGMQTFTAKAVKDLLAEMDGDVWTGRGSMMRLQQGLSRLGKAGQIVKIADNKWEVPS